MSLSFLFTDHNGNPSPLGRTISFATDVGTLVGGSSFTVPNTNVDAGSTSPTVVGSLVASVRIDETPDNATAETGVLTITATPPGGGNPSSLLIYLFDAMN